jgi:drug/metabolite transporter (DMT)-like permease
MSLAGTVRRHPRRAAALALTVLSLVWGYNWVISKRALAYAGALDFAALRTLLAAISLFAVLVVLKCPMALKDVRGALVLGLLQTTAFIGLTLLALANGGAGRTAVLVYTMPAWVILLARLVLHEQVRGPQRAALALALLGLLLMLGMLPQGAGLASMLLALAAGTFWAAATLYAKRLQTRRDCDVLALTAWQMLLRGIPLALLALAWPGPAIHGSPYFGFALLYNALLGGALAWTLWLCSLARLPAGVASLGTPATPAIGVLAAWLELGEVPDAGEAAGMLLIGAALVLVSWQTIRAHRRVSPATAQE